MPLDASVEDLLRDLVPQVLGAVTRQFGDFSAAEDAVRSHLLERAGDDAAAVVHYRTAAARTTSIAERDYLTMKAARLAQG
jgi:predicted RNA polymerase sigma factor